MLSEFLKKSILKNLEENTTEIKLTTETVYGILIRKLPHQSIQILKKMNRCLNNLDENIEAIKKGGLPLFLLLKN